jgi:CDP-diglyceride synthetase
MLLPLNSQQCFFITMLVFIVVGFSRGWRREVMSLVFVLLAVVLIHPDTSDALNGFLARLGNFITYLSGSGGQLNSPPSSSGISFLAGPFWSLVIFVLIVALGYYVGNRVFPQPGTSHERFIGVIPAIISGAFVLFYLSSYAKSNGGSANLQVQVAPPDPSTFVPVIFVLALIALVVGLIASRFKKASGKK